MIDTVRINIRAGNGGNGCSSFLRQKFNPRGGPNGGDGGDGGSAYLCGDPSVNTLLHLKFNSTIYGAAGGHGKGNNRRGANGEDTIIKVPIGTEVVALYADGRKEFLADIVDDNPEVVVRGGRGGWGNAHYVTATNREPVLSQRGERGEAVVLFLELKLLADVGLLARPNAGKSTLISRCSAARPKIAEYPFTTVEPVLGVVRTRGTEFVMMEVPGLLEGAHAGVGLGYKFLRHAERARLYIHLIDGLSEDPEGDLRMLREELSRFNATLLDKPRVIAVNKIDVTEVRQARAIIDGALRKAAAPSGGGPDELGSPVFFISAATGEGVDALLGKVIELLQDLPKGAPARRVRERPEARAREKRQADTIYVEDGVFVVECADVERLAALADTRDPRVIVQLWRELNRRGLAKKLEGAGVQVGDTVRIGSTEVEWL